MVDSIHHDGGEAHGQLANLADPDECSDFIAATLSKGPVDILVNNAAAFVSRGWEDTTPEEWLELYPVNVAAAVRLVQGFGYVNGANLRIDGGSTAVI